MTRLYIHAVNVHQGGGKALMDALLKIPATRAAVIQVDSRMSLSTELLQAAKIRRVMPTVLQRILADWWLAKQVRQGDVVLCFGNLPPLLRLQGHVTVFLQNRYLVDDVKLNGFPLKTRLRLMIERLWLSTRISNVDEFVVQTPSMKILLQGRTAAHVHVLPFMTHQETYKRAVAAQGVRRNVQIDFLYVASGEPHKNHRKLIEAWCLLAEQGLFPSLKLTLDKAVFPELGGWLEQKIVRYGLNVENLGSLPHEKVLALYGRAGALIYPSTLESFGLPLIEARQAGLPILASELDYVRDVIDPEETFDPQSAVSIARAVKRYLGLEEPPLPLQDAGAFLKHVFETSEQSANSRR